MYRNGIYCRRHRGGEGEREGALDLLSYLPVGSLTNLAAKGCDIPTILA